jgi:hypothetical protein
MNNVSGANKQIYFIVINIISFSPFIYFLNYVWKNNKPDDATKIAGLFFILFLPSFSFWNLYGNYIRQAWAFTFSLGLLIALMDKRYLLATLFSIIALSSHSSGILFVLAVCIAMLGRGVNIHKKSFFALLISILFATLPIIKNIIIFLPAGIYSKLDFYSTWSGDDFGKTAIIRLAIAFLYLFVVNHFLLRKVDKECVLYSKIFYLYIIIMLVVSIVSDITKVVERLYYPVFVMFFILASFQYVFFLRRLNTLNKIFFSLITVSIGIPLLGYSLFSSLLYVPSFYDGSLASFLLFNYKGVL